MTRLGHQHGPDGTLWRLDIERGPWGQRYVGTHYGTDRNVVLRLAIGSYEQVTQEMKGWK